jgi:hypothetical protein
MIKTLEYASELLGDVAGADRVEVRLDEERSDEITTL